MVGWLAGWLVGWLAGWLAGWVIEWLDGWVVEWLSGWVVEWSSGWVVERLSGREFEWLSRVEWLSDWLGDWLINWLGEWLGDWLGNWLGNKLSDKLSDWLIDCYLLIVIYWLIDLWLIDYLFRNNTSGEEITGKSWYYGAISRGECDILMSERGQDGDFIVRDSESTVSWQDMHLLQYADNVLIWFLFDLPWTENFRMRYP